MGGVTDTFLEYAFGVLDTLALAIHWDVPTAMFGQGIGPIQSLELIARSKEILPKIDLISLREGRAGLPLLQSLGVSPNHLLVTGDDAIELAYSSHRKQLGPGLGVNLRAASYSHVNHSYVERIRPVLQEISRLNRAPLVPIPISRVPGEEDLVTIQQLFAGHQDVMVNEEDIDTQMKVIRQIHQCRVVVTGSYHAAVFALAMGIPAVGLAKSEYYVDKFLGLAELFGNGCQVVLLDDINMPIRLRDAIEKVWELAEHLRPELLQAAVHQIKLGHTAYQRLYKITASNQRSI
jgi:polysaccharide pyruvyl transferase WcaK-like protein